jgi:hypothetical protein
LSVPNFFWYPIIEERLLFGLSLHPSVFEYCRNAKRISFFPNLRSIWWRHDTYHNDTESNDTQHISKSTNLSITLCWVPLLLNVFILKIVYAECRYFLVLFMVSVVYAEFQILLNIFILKVVYGECHLCWVSLMPSVLYAECYLCWVSFMLSGIYAKWLYAECHITECHGNYMISCEGCEKLPGANTPTYFFHHQWQRKKCFVTSIT